MPGIIDFPQFNYEDMEEIVAGGEGLLVTYIRTTPTPLLVLFIPYKFLVRKKKRGHATKRLSSFFFPMKAYVKRFDVTYL